MKKDLSLDKQVTKTEKSASGWFFMHVIIWDEEDIEVEAFNINLERGQFKTKSAKKKTEPRVVVPFYRSKGTMHGWGKYEQTGRGGYEVKQNDIPNPIKIIRVSDINDQLNTFLVCFEHEIKGARCFFKVEKYTF